MESYTKLIQSQNFKDIKRKIVLHTEEFVLNNRNLETRGKRSIWQQRVQFWCQASLRVEAGHIQHVI
jgi:hypothetical protein